MSCAHLVELVQARLEGQTLTTEDLAYIEERYDQYSKEWLHALADDLALELEAW